MAAEPARLLIKQPLPRVAILAAPARRAPLADLLQALGYERVDEGSADIVLAEADLAAAPSAPVVMLGGSFSESAGTLPADATPAQIDAALRAVHAGLTVRPLAPPPARFAALDDEEISPLTPRELEVLMALSDGLSNKAIARRFDISQHTVKFHVEAIFRKLGTKTRAEAVAKGLKRGIVQL